MLLNNPEARPCSVGDVISGCPAFVIVVLTQAAGARAHRHQDKVWTETGLVVLVIPVPGLDPGINPGIASTDGAAWIPGSSPGMTMRGLRG
jgi:hypothetical protein